MFHTLNIQFFTSSQVKNAFLISNMPDDQDSAITSGQFYNPYQRLIILPLTLLIVWTCTSPLVSSHMPPCLEHWPNLRVNHPQSPN